MFWSVYLFFCVNRLVTTINQLSSVFIGYGLVIFGLQKRLTSYGLGYQFWDQLTGPNWTFEHYVTVILAMCWIHMGNGKKARKCLKKIEKKSARALNKFIYITKTLKK